MKSQLIRFAFQILIKVLIGPSNYSSVLALVQNAEKTSLNLSGSEKREQVLREAHAKGIEFGTALLNLAIETAVHSLKVK